MSRTHKHFTLVKRGQYPFADSAENVREGLVPDTHRGYCPVCDGPQINHPPSFIREAAVEIGRLISMAFVVGCISAALFCIVVLR